MASRRRERARVKLRRMQQKNRRARSRWLGRVRQELERCGVPQAVAPDDSDE